MRDLKKASVFVRWARGGLRTCQRVRGRPWGKPACTCEHLTRLTNKYTESMLCTPTQRNSAQTAAGAPRCPAPLLSGAGPGGRTVCTDQQLKLIVRSAPYKRGELAVVGVSPIQLRAVPTAHDARSFRGRREVVGAVGTEVRELLDVAMKLVLLCVLLCVLLSVCVFLSLSLSLSL